MLLSVFSCCSTAAVAAAVKGVGGGCGDGDIDSSSVVRQDRTEQRTATKSTVMIQTIIDINEFANVYVCVFFRRLSFLFLFFSLRLLLNLYMNS